MRKAIVGLALIVPIMSSAGDLRNCDRELSLKNDWSVVGKDTFAIALNKFRGQGIADGKAFRTSSQHVDRVLTLRIKRFFFNKILSGEKSFEYRVRNGTNDALIASALRRKVQFLRLHFQDNNIQLLARIEFIDVVSGEQATEPWDVDQGIEPSTAPHWRIAISDPRLIWKNPKSIEAAKALGLTDAF